SGAVVQVAETAPRLANVRHCAALLRPLSRESRSSRELGARRAAASDDVSWPPSRADSAPASRSADAAAVSGRRVRLVEAVPLLRRSQAGARGRGAKGTGRVSLAVPVDQDDR